MVKSRRMKPGMVPKKRGAALTDGDKSPRFQEYLRKMGISKEEMLAGFEDGSKSIIDSVKRRSIGLQVYQSMIEPIVAFYTDMTKRGVNLQEDLYLLETDLIEYRLKMQQDPEWEPLGDKTYQDGLQRKAQMMQYINRFNLDFAKLKAEMNKKGYGDDVINVTEMKLDDD